MNAGLSIIILNWNQEKDTTECLHSLRKADNREYEVILIDNGSKDNSPDNLEKLFPDVKMIKNPENLGFAEGNNVGIREALRQGAEWVMLLNNDTTVEPDFIRALMANVSHDEKIGVASPKIMFYKNPDKIWFAGGAYRPFLKKPFHRYYGEPDSGQVQKMAEVSWVSGCCMLIKREVFEKIGLLDADYFYSCEDVDFCVRAQKAGYKIVVVPEAKIYHKFAASLGSKFSPWYTYFRTRNNLLFFKKTKQWLPLILSFTVFPVYELLRNKNLQCVKAIFLALRDFMAGKYGMGSVCELKNE